MIETTTRNAPAFWACYFINGDATGFDYGKGEEDQAEADSFLADLAAEGWRVVSTEGEEFFGRFNGKYCDLVTYTLHR